MATPSNTTPSSNSSPSGHTIPIDPSCPSASSKSIYRLLISAIIPRPIALLSTLSPTASPNLAPFSYFNIMSHDPPIFVIGFATGLSKPKDSLRNLLATRECTINIVSEDMLEAVNTCSMNAPYGVSEWEIAGLTPVESDCVRPCRVAESRFVVEGKLVEVPEFESRRTPGESNSAMAVIEGVKFWAWKEDGKEGVERMDLDVLKPVSRLGGITYGKVVEGVQMARPTYEGPTKL